MPEISVVMPTYNVVDYIASAIQSILNQTYNNFEFIIVDDASTDGTSEVISSFSDSRIRLYRNNKNEGVIGAANKAMKLAKGKYIARMDSDDIAFENRLERQISFLDNNHNIDILGASYQVLESNKIVHQSKYDNEIKLKMLKNMPFVNPTIMMRSNILKKFNLKYDEKYPSAEDYDFFVEAALSGAKMANLGEVLLYYRIHEKQITQAKADEQKATSDKIRMKYFKSIFGDSLTESDLSKLKSYEDSISMNVEEAFPILNKLIKGNKKNNFFSRKDLNPYLYDLMVHAIKNTSSVNRRKLLSKNISLELRLLLLKYYIKNSI